MAGGEGTARTSRIGAHTAITSLCCERSTVHEPLACCAQVVRPEKEPKPEPKHVVKMPGAGRGNNPASHANLKRRAKKEQSENEEQPQQPRPQYGVMPNSISDVRDYAPMSSFLLMANPHAWAAMLSSDGSGEVQL